MYYQSNVEMPLSNLSPHKIDVLTFGHFENIVEELKVNSIYIQQQLSDMLDFMNQIKYQKAIQDNAKIHLIDKSNYECQAKTKLVDVVEPVNQIVRAAHCTEAKTNGFNESKLTPGNRIVRSNNYVNLDKRFKKLWMTEEIYQLIQARKRFTFAVRLYPESKYLKSQLRFYEQAVYRAVDWRKANFYRKPRYYVQNKAIAPPEPSQTPSSVGKDSINRLPSNASPVGTSNQSAPAVSIDSNLDSLPNLPSTGENKVKKLQSSPVESSGNNKLLLPRSRVSGNSSDNKPHVSTWKANPKI